MRAEIASELAPDAPLIRFGLVRHDGDSPLFAALSADPVLVEHLRGREAGSASGVAAMRGATRTFAELHLPAEVKRDLVLALAEPRPFDAPLRLVLRGRRGAGRHSAIAALAERVGRRVAAIDAHRLPRNASRLAAGLRVELVRARWSAARSRWCRGSRPSTPPTARARRRSTGCCACTPGRS